MGLVLAAMPAIAQAGTITTATVSAGPKATDFGYILGVDKYNGAQPLLSVQFFNSNRVQDSQLDLTNNALSDQNFRFIATVDTALTTNLANGWDGGTTSNTVLNTGFVTFTAGQFIDYAPKDITFTGTSGVDTNATDLAAVTGSVTLNFAGATHSGTSFSGGGGNIALGQTQQATVSVYAVYTYQDAPSAVPEPSTFALVGLGGLGLAVRALRRRQAAV